MNVEQSIQLINVLEEIRDELHSQNVINAERNMVLEYLMPYGVNSSCDLPTFTREYLNDNAKGGEE